MMSEKQIRAMIQDMETKRENFVNRTLQPRKPLKPGQMPVSLGTNYKHVNILDAQIGILKTVLGDAQ